MKQAQSTTSIKRAGLGVLAAVGATLLVCGLLSVLVLQEILPIQAAPGMAAALSALSVFGACYLTARQAPQKRLPISMAMAAVYTLLCLLSKAVAFPVNSFHWNWTAVLPFAAAAAAGLLSSRKKRRRR